MLNHNAVVYSMNCYASAPDEECCKALGAGDEFGLSFCLMTCVLCCTSCDITWEYPDAPAAPEAQQLQARDYPTFTNNFNGVSFTQSSYGVSLPIIYGADKLNGNVFWSSGFENNSVTVEGEPFFYTTTSFALGISEDEIVGLSRMWLGDKVILDNSAEIDANGVADPEADGFLYGGIVDVLDPDSPLRNITSANTQTKITVFSGSRTQIPEGIIVDKEGYGSTPAYRGVGFILFENFIVTNNTIPNISVEVISNTGNKKPRVYGSLPAVDANNPFDDLSTNIVLDISYNRIYVPANGPSSARGFAVFNNSTLEYIESFEIANRYGINLDYTSVWVTSQGMLLTLESDGNGSNIHLVNPFTGDIDSSLINEGSALQKLNHSFEGITNCSQESQLVYARSSNGSPKDIFVAVASFGEHSVAYVEVDPTTSKMTVKGYENNIVGMKQAVRGAAVTYTQQDADINPTFKDGASVIGTHVFYIGQGSGTTTYDEFSFCRHNFSSDSTGPTITSPTTTILDPLSMDLFEGSGAAPHSLEIVLTDERDGTLLLFIDATQDMVVKFDPITETVKWKALLPTGVVPFNFKTGMQGYINGPSLTFIAEGADRILTLDLNTGVIEDTVGVITTQELPLAASNAWTYNSFEGTITYLAESNPSKALTKVFISKVTRQTVDLPDIIVDLLDRIGISQDYIDISDVAALALHGYTISSVSTLRNIFSELAQVFKYDLIESNGKFVYNARGSSPVKTLTKDDMADVNENGWLEENQENPIARTRKINLTYKDIDRDYDPNVQNVSLPKVDDTAFDIDAAIDVQVPIVLKAEEAKRLAEILIYAKSVYNSSYNFNLGTKHIDLDPSDVVVIESEDDEDKVVRIRDISIGADRTIDINASEEDPDIYNDVVSLFGDIGRFDRPSTPSIALRNDPFLLAIPYRRLSEAEESNDNYYIYITFLNLGHNSPPSSNITITMNGTESYTLSPPVGTPTWGYVRTPLQARSNWHSTDNDSIVTVKMASNLGGTLASVTKEDLLNDPELNLCYMGGELVQFTTVTPLGDDLYSFRGFHRARLGTDQFVLSHVSGEKFVLLDEHSVLRFDVPTGNSPRRALQIFSNSNNPFTPPSIQYVVPFNLRPWNVAGLRGEYAGDDANITWKARSRTTENELEDGNDTVFLPDGGELYDIYCYKDTNSFNPYNEATYLRKETTTETSYVYSLADQISDNFDNATETLYFLVYQAGSVTGLDVGSGVNAQLKPKS